MAAAVGEVGEAEVVLDRHLHGNLDQRDRPEQQHEQDRHHGSDRVGQCESGQIHDDTCEEQSILCG